MGNLSEQREDRQLSIMDSVNMDAIEEFCRQVYYCDPYTAMHAEHVAELMAGLASQMSMTSEEINLAFMVGLVHDVGKIKTPHDILAKPGRLTNEEFAVMKQHAQHGADMLCFVEGADKLVPIMRHHHERYDGNGYPKGLKGKRIPLLSRMLAICDSFDAMTTKRCYRSPVTLPECVEEIKSCSGSQFDPDIAAYFVEFLEDRFGFTVV